MSLLRELSRTHRDPDRPVGSGTPQNSASGTLLRHIPIFPVFSGLRDSHPMIFALETTILYTLLPRKSGGFVGYRRGPQCRVFQLDRESLVPPSWVAGQSLSGLIQQSLQDRTSLGAARKGEVHQRAVQCVGCVLRICCRNCLKPVELSFPSSLIVVSSRPISSVSPSPSFSGAQGD